MVAGTVLDGQYRIEREVGRGSSGPVYAALDLRLERRVAVKIGPHEASAKMRFLREAQAAARLGSKHVVRILRAAELPDGRPFLVMELLVGETLAERLARDPRVPMRRAVDWILEILDGLAEAHESGLVHRDVKPSNIFLVDRGDLPPTAKLLDFGLVKDLTAETLTQSGEGFGTPSYVAPEQIHGASRADPRSDVWSAGVVLYQLVAGRLPFERPNVSDLLAAIAREPPAPLEGVPPPLHAIVTRCLEKRPSDRFENAESLRRALLAARPRRATRGVGRVLAASAITGAVVGAGSLFAVFALHRPSHAMIARAPRPPIVVASAPLADVPEAPRPLLAPADPAASERPTAGAPSSRRRVRVEGAGFVDMSEAHAGEWLAAGRPEIEACSLACSGAPFFLRASPGRVDIQPAAACPPTSKKCFEEIVRRHPMPNDRGQVFVRVD